MKNEIQQESLINDLKQQCVIVDGELFFYENEGNTRIVYANENKTFVIKILININDFNHNQKESKIDDPQFAKTELLNNGWLKQEYVEKIEQIGRPLTFAEIRFVNSCNGEVGFINNEVKCYDYDQFKKN